ncbi:ATP-binding cassette domain-containing protein [Aerococcus urinaeequi]|uniref:ATP-binding cassette domain-containing protein n=1 Tax=Aerococcus urinaeequi TaxID=51665 RepID=UPI003B3B73A8
MLLITHLTMTQASTLFTVIDDLSFVVNPGDKVAIIGEEGNGKSSILKYIVGDESIQSYLEITGQMANHFTKLAYLPQAMANEDLAKSLENYFFRVRDYADVDYQLLYQLGNQLDFDVDRIYDQQLVGDLSGGERIKLQLIDLLMDEPDLLLMDEPSNDLDVETSLWLEKFIQQSDLAMIYISHDELLLKRTASHILHVERLTNKSAARSTFVKDSYENYLTHRDQEMSNQENLANKQREEDQKRMAKFNHVHDSVDHQLNNTKDSTAGRLLAKKMKAVQSMDKRFERERAKFVDHPIKEAPIHIEFSNVNPLGKSQVVVHLDDGQVTINDRILADNLQLTAKGQDKIGIIGPNGIGKTTFLRQLWHDLKDAKGFQVGYMPQQYSEEIPDDQTPIEFMTTTGDKEERTQIMTYLGSLRFLPEEMDQPIAYLSGGQKGKLILASLDLKGYNVLLLDEPTRNFSASSQQEIRTVFNDYPGAIITVSHDRQFLKSVCDTVYELSSDGFKIVDYVNQW